MFCNQCEETPHPDSCITIGACGKTDQASTLQDLLVYISKGISFWLIKAKDLNIKDKKADLFVVECLFSTITNVNFDDGNILDLIKEALVVRDQIKERVQQAWKDNNIAPEDNIPDAAAWQSDVTLEDCFSKGTTVGLLMDSNEDIRSLKQLIIYGLKGMAAYADHASILEYEDSEIFAFIHEALVATLNPDISSDELIDLVMQVGKVSVDTMALLDKAATETYGTPEITQVTTSTKAAPAILVSGHDLRDLEEILIQTQGTGVQVYTHGEMLPGHAYPKLKKYKNLIGNYGSAWHNQQKEFESFGGAILLTTNCIVKPKDSYQDRLFTTGLVRWPGVSHIPNRTIGSQKDYSLLINKALELGSLEETDGKDLTIGFAHNTVLSLADKVIEAVKSGAIKKFVVMAGCDGRHKERQYYTDMAEALPQDTVILTAGCAKFRYNTLNLGDINGIPRILDAGQCNDSYSLAVIALKLKEAFGLEDINDLPIAYDIAWYEQKAVSVLLALLYLGVKGIRLGPTLPAFISPNVLKVLVEKFDIKPISTVAEDLSDMLPGWDDQAEEKVA